MRTTKKQSAVKLGWRLNDIIYTRNLYRQGRRYINACFVGFDLTVEDLHTGDRINFVNDGSFTDCNNKPVILD